MKANIVLLSLLIASICSGQDRHSYLVAGRVSLHDYVVVYTLNEHYFVVPQDYLILKDSLPEYILLNDYRCFVLSEKKPNDVSDMSLQSFEFSGNEHPSFLVPIEDHPTVKGVQRVLLYKKRPSTFTLFLISPELWNSKIARFGRHIPNVRPFNHLSTNYWIRALYPRWSE